MNVTLYAYPLYNNKKNISILGNLFPKVAEKLNQAALPIIDFQTCSKPAYWWDTLRPSMVCAGYESPDELKSACQVSGHLQKQRNQLQMWMVLCAEVLFNIIITRYYTTHCYVSVLASNDWVVFYVTCC